ncbi:MAG TPA: MBOAT family protein [Thermoanaerobaculia bacterium]|nr:MBOAT family protein [Thermoanaerobaculia bacterium]
MTGFTGVAIWAAAMFLIAALGGSRIGARVGVLVAVLLLPLPVLVTGVAIRIGLLAFLIAACLARAVDFAFGRAPRGFGARLLYSFAFLAFVDTLLVSRRSRSFDGGSAARIVIAFTVGGTALALWSAPASFPFWVRYPMRCFLGGTVVLAMAEITTGVVRVITGVFGVTLPPVHDAPYRSRTVSEFWNRRWNLATGRWLREYCFMPLARRGVMFALCAAFAASAALHAYLIVFVDPSAALSWAAFFFAQPVLMVLERQLQVRRWSRAAGRAWTMATLLLLFPLLLSPVLPLFKTHL